MSGEAPDNPPSETHKKILTHHALFPVVGHTGTVYSVVWGADGKRLASGSADETVRVWDAETGELLHIFEVHTDEVNSVVWRVDGKRLASGSADKTVRVWDGETGEVLHTLLGHTKAVLSVAWSVDGKRLASGSADKTVRVWNVETGRVLRNLKAHTESVTSVAWSADGKRLASGSADKTVRVWDTQSWKELHILKSHTESVTSVAWSADGKRLASGSDDKTVRVWDGETGKRLRTLKDHTESVTSVAWSADGKRLASGSADQTVQVWDVEIETQIFLPGYHTGRLFSVAWDADGKRLASGSGDDNMVRVWDAETRQLLHTLESHTDSISSVAWDADGKRLASGSYDNSVQVWDVETGELLHILQGHTDRVFSVVWDADGKRLASGSDDQTVRVWDAETGEVLYVLEGHTGDIYSVAWSADGKRLASGSEDITVRVWDGETGKLLHILEGHTSYVHSVAWVADGGLFVSQSNTEIRLWHPSSFEIIEIMEPVTTSGGWDSLAYSPASSRLATLDKDSTTIHIWDVDVAAIGKVKPVEAAVHYTTAKIALVGDSSVGKTGLGYRLAEHEFQVTESTHGQQFWVVDELGTTRADGTLCEAILWDFAGQANYRPVHTLFLEDIDIALLLFDPARPDTLSGVEFWLKHLQDKQHACRTILVAARTDVSQSSIATSELEAFCREHAIEGMYVATSAKLNTGVETLLQRIRQQIGWEAKATTVTTQTFKRIKDYVLQLKANAERTQILVSPVQLRQQLQQTDASWRFSDAEMMAAVGHLQNHGYVTILRWSATEERILLAPDVLINLAASFLLKARENEKGLGSLDEARVLHNEYQFPEVEVLGDEEKDILLNAVTELFLKRNMCFRESDADDVQTFLIFPSLILERPPRLVEDALLVEDMAYRVTGNVENVYPALVVLLGYTPTFRRTHQWRQQAQYETAKGHICSFRLTSDSRGGELELVLYYGKDTPEHMRMRFQGLFEEVLSKRDVKVKRYAPVICPACRLLQNRQTTIKRVRDNKTFVACEEGCGNIPLLPATDVMPVNEQVRDAVVRDKAAIRRRTTYEAALVRVKGLLRDRGDRGAPSCFISYAWGTPEHERWVLQLANDLKKADINVILDQIDNAAIGSSISRFISLIEQSKFVVPVGTPSYYEKYVNKHARYGHVVAAEVHLIEDRLMGNDEQQESVLPILLYGDEHVAFPPLMRRRVYGDFRREETYFVTLFDLLLTLYRIPFDHPMVQDVRAKLRDEAASRDDKRLLPGV